MKCPKCGNENENDAKFCRSCGERLQSNIIKVNTNKDDSTKKIIMALIAIAVILLAGVAAYATGIIHTGPELQTQEFDGFKLDVPVDSDFVLDESFTSNPDNIFVGYINNGNNLEIGAFQVGTNLSTKVLAPFAELVEEDGDLKIYKNESDGISIYEVYKEGNEANIVIYGADVDTMKKMANSFQDKDFSKLATNPSEPTPVTSTETQPTASTQVSTPMQILGGSFSTGSSLEDKTYASIYVGPEHAGENVKIQIWYSRDGTTLNNGNMVPKTVDSSGYINVKSADAYSQYPDFAEINLYDTNGNLMDSVSVTLTPDSGTQSF